jgi:hypothetical protein
MRLNFSVIGVNMERACVNDVLILNINKIHDNERFHIEEALVQELTGKPFIKHVVFLFENMLVKDITGIGEALVDIVENRMDRSVPPVSSMDENLLYHLCALKEDDEGDFPHYMETHKLDGIDNFYYFEPFMTHDELRALVKSDKDR